ncbi:hypothetical protein [Micromonospora sp. KC606]|uniref:hypothetical protein n=1 Tax=Micromonospora sp. KC606 TaxID=2530379 RepID=UPI001404F6A0|nr:hypothetical protein [Micromonospora sp. KC606]
MRTLLNMDIARTPEIVNMAAVKATPNTFPHVLRIALAINAPAASRFPERTLCHPAMSTD